MRPGWALALILLAGCSTPGSGPKPVEPLASKPIVPCMEPRPALCTLEYAPVCARLKSGDFRTYASGCSACGDSSVEGYQSGPCKE